MPVIRVSDWRQYDTMQEREAHQAEDEADLAPETNEYRYWWSHGTIAEGE